MLLLGPLLVAPFVQQLLCLLFDSLVLLLQHLLPVQNLLFLRLDDLEVLFILLLNLRRLLEQSLQTLVVQLNLLDLFFLSTVDLFQVSNPLLLGLEMSLSIFYYLVAVLYLALQFMMLLFIHRCLLLQLHVLVEQLLVRRDTLATNAIHLNFHLLHVLQVDFVLDLQLTCTQHFRRPLDLLQLCLLLLQLALETLDLLLEVVVGHNVSAVGNVVSFLDEAVVV